MDPYRHGRCADCGEADKDLVNCAQCGRKHCARCSAAGLCQICLSKAIDATSWVLKLAGATRLRGRRGAWLAAFARLGAVAALGAMVGMAASIREQTVSPLSSGGHAKGAPAASAVCQVAPVAASPYLPGGPRSAALGAPEAPRPRRSLDSIKTSLERAAAPWPASLLGALGSLDPSPEALLARARNLQKAGFDLTIVNIQVSPEAVKEALAEGLQGGLVLPVMRHDQPLGVALYGYGERSLPRLAGLANGDIVTSINGAPLTSAEQAIAAYSQTEARRAAVLEVVRGGRRLVVAIRWA